VHEKSLDIHYVVYPLFYDRQNTKMTVVGEIFVKC
jgi:hypothetical protein